MFTPTITASSCCKSIGHKVSPRAKDTPREEFADQCMEMGARSGEAQPRASKAEPLGKREREGESSDERMTDVVPQAWTGSCCARRPPRSLETLGDGGMHIY